MEDKECSVQKDIDKSDICFGSSKLLNVDISDLRQKESSLSSLPVISTLNHKPSFGNSYFKLIG